MIRRLFRNIVTVGAGSAVSKLLLVILELFLAAHLGAAEYGLYAVGFGIVLVLSITLQMGLNFAVVQYVSIYEESGETDRAASVARVSLILVGSVSLVVAAGIVAASETLARVVFRKPDLAEVLVLVAIAVPFESLNQCLGAVFRSLRLFRHHVAVVDLVRNVALLSCIPLALLDRISVVVVFQVFALGSAAGTMFGLALLSRRFRLLSWSLPDVEMIRRLGAFSWLLFFWQVLQSSANHLILVVAGAVLDAVDVGILALVVRTLNVLTFPQTIVNTAAPVEFIRLYHAGKLSELNRLFQLTAHALTAVAAVIGMPLLLNANPFMETFGSEYAGYGWALWPLLLAKVADVGTGPAGQILIAAEKRGAILGLSVLDIAAQFLVVVPLMMGFGLVGAVGGNAMRMIVLVGVRHGVVYATLRLWSVTGSLVRLFGAATVSLGVGLVVAGLESDRGLRIGATVSMLGTFAALSAVLLRRHGLGYAELARRARSLRDTRPGARERVRIRARLGDRS